MKNKIELKEQLLVLEAEYKNIFNRNYNNCCKYWYDKDKQYKARELSQSIEKCKHELEILQTAKTIQDELSTLRRMKDQMVLSMNNTTAIPSSFKTRLDELDDKILCLQESYNQVFVNN